MPSAPRSSCSRSGAHSSSAASPCSRRPRCSSPSTAACRSPSGPSAQASSLLAGWSARPLCCGGRRGSSSRSCSSTAPFRLPLDFGREHRFYVAIAHGGQLGRLLPLYAVLCVCRARTSSGTPSRAARCKPLPRDDRVAGGGVPRLDVAVAALDERARVGPHPARVLPAPVRRAGRSRRSGAVPGANASSPRVRSRSRSRRSSRSSGLVEAATHRLIFYSHNLARSANTYSSFFRVTSLFRDPNLYGRHVVLGIVVLVVCLWLRQGRRPGGDGADRAAVGRPLLLVLPVELCRALRRRLRDHDRDGRGRIRWVAIAAAVVVALVGAGIAASKVARHIGRKATSDRSRRIELTAKVWVAPPARGVGIGGQPIESQRLADRLAPARTFVSHTTPLTVAAELGTIGVLLYVGLLAGSAVDTLGGAAATSRRSGFRSRRSSSRSSCTRSRTAASSRIR